MYNKPAGEASIKLSVREGVFHISLSDIIRLKACNSYTYIYFTNRRPMIISKVLKAFQHLYGHGFIRIHRAHLVNSRYISCIGNDGKIVMTDKSVAGVSKRMKQQVMKQLQAAA